MKEWRLVKNLTERGGCPFMEICHACYFWTLLLFIRYLLFVNRHLRTIKKASGTANNTSATAIIWRPVKPMMEHANRYILQSRFPMITKFWSLNQHFGNNLYIISTDGESGACLVPIFRFQASAASSTNILPAQELGLNLLNESPKPIGVTQCQFLFEGMDKFRIVTRWGKRTKKSNITNP